MENDLSGKASLRSVRTLRDSSIIRSIADKYGGEAMLELQEDSFLAAVVLKNAVKFS